MIFGSARQRRRHIAQVATWIKGTGHTDIRCNYGHWRPELVDRESGEVLEDLLGAILSEYWVSGLARSDGGFVLWDEWGQFDAWSQWGVHEGSLHLPLAATFHDVVLYPPSTVSMIVDGCVLEWDFGAATVTRFPPNPPWLDALLTGPPANLEPL